MKSKLRLEPLTFCLCWIALAVAASLLGGTWAGLAVALGLLLVLMPTSAFILSRYEDEKATAGDLADALVTRPVIARSAATRQSSGPRGPIRVLRQARSDEAQSSSSS